MSYTDFRTLQIGNPGTTTPPKFGSDNVDEIMKIFNGVVVPNRRPNILNPWVFSGPVTFFAVGSVPGAPPNDTTIYLYVDPTSKRLVVKKQSGVVELETIFTNISQAGDVQFTSLANNDAIRWNSSISKWVNTQVTGTGEANTASNQGTSGIGIFKQKLGVDLQLKKINPASSRVSITDNTGNGTVDIDVSLTGILLTDLGGTLSVAKGGTGQTALSALSLASIGTDILAVARGGTGVSSLASLSLNSLGGPLNVNKGGTGLATLTANALLVGNGTAAPTLLLPGSNGQVLSIVSGVPAWSTSAAGGGTVLPDGTTSTKPRYGIFYGGGLDGFGQLSGLVINGVSHGTAPTATDNFTTFTADVVDGAIGGISTPGIITRRDYNPTFAVKFKCTQSSERLWAGLTTDPTQDTNTDDHLDGKSGVGITFSDVVDNFTAHWNNGAGTQQTTASATPKNTLVHTVKFELDNAAGSVKVTFDGTLLVNSTTAVPAATTGLYFHANQESIGTTGPTLQLAWMYIVQDH